MGQAVHIQGRIVTRSGKDIGIFAGVVEGVMEAVDGGNQASGNCIEVAALTSGQIHGRGQRRRRFLCCQTSTGKVQTGIRRIAHAVCRIGCSFGHRAFQQFSLFSRVTHGLVGQRHDLIDLGILGCRNGAKADHGSRRRHDGLACALDLLADLLHLFTSSRDLLRTDGAELVHLGIETFQLLLGLCNLTLQGVPFRAVVIASEFHLRRRFFERFEALFGGVNGCGQIGEFLLEQFGVAGIQLQQLIDVFQIVLTLTRRPVNIGERLGQFCCVAVQLYGNTGDPATRHIITPALEFIEVRLCRKLVIAVRLIIVRGFDDHIEDDSLVQFFHLRE